jgi:hypothetical protein
MHRQPRRRQGAPRDTGRTSSTTAIARQTTTPSRPTPHHITMATNPSCPTVTFHEPDGEPPDLAASFPPSSLPVTPTFVLCYLFLMPLEH